MNLAIFQGCSRLGEVQKNLEKMEIQMQKAKKMGANLIVFPEMFTTGYRLSSETIKTLAEERNGSVFLKVSQYARDVDMAVLYGYPEFEEKDGSKLYYNSAQFIDREGKSLANYRKTHLWIDHHKTEAVFTPGDDLSRVFEFHGYKIGLLICYDVEFCEAVRTLALKGAEVILAPTAYCKDSDASFIPDVLVCAHAFENAVHIAYVNHSGGGFAGLSRCYNPKGEALIKCGPEDEGLFLAKIESGYRDSNHIADRRPDLYKTLCKTTD